MGDLPAGDDLQSRKRRPSLTFNTAGFAGKTCTTHGHSRRTLRQYSRIGALFEPTYNRNPAYRAITGRRHRAPHQLAKEGLSTRLPCAAPPQRLRKSGSRPSGGSAQADVHASPLDESTSQPDRRGRLGTLGYLAVSSSNSLDTHVLRLSNATSDIPSSTDWRTVLKSRPCYEKSTRLDRFVTTSLWLIWGLVDVVIINLNQTCVPLCITSRRIHGGRLRTRN